MGEVEGGSSANSAMQPPRLPAGVEGPGKQRLRQIVTTFNESRQRRSDFERAIEELERALDEYGPRIPREAAENAEGLIQQLKQLLPDAVATYLYYGHYGE